MFITHQLWLLFFSNSATNSFTFSASSAESQKTYCRKPLSFFCLRSAAMRRLTHAFSAMQQLQELNQDKRAGGKGSWFGGVIRKLPYLHIIYTSASINDADSHTGLPFELSFVSIK